MGSLSRLLDHYGDTVEIFHGHGDGSFSIETRHDAGPAERAAAILSDEDTAKADGMRLERIIPPHVLERSVTEGWFHDQAAWRRWANSSEGHHFAVRHNGRVKAL